jgi:predicted transcriptional regulator
MRNCSSARWWRPPRCLQDADASSTRPLGARINAAPTCTCEVARRVNRDVKAVHADVTALLMAGVLDRTESGQIEFPYETVKVEFELEAV